MCVDWLKKIIKFTIYVAIWKNYVNCLHNDFSFVLDWFRLEPEPKLGLLQIRNREKSLINFGKTPQYQIT